MKRHAARLILEFVVGLPLFPGPVRSSLLRACGVVVGAGTRIRSRCVFTDSCVSFGARTWVNFGVTFNATAPISIGDDVQIAHSVVITTATHELGDRHRRAGASVNEPIVVGDGCWLGVSVTVLPGVTIGRGCIIAAGAVVTRDCEPDGLYGGVPAARIRDLDGTG
ncbi:MAG: acyltransferase [Solirubrobacteraceae bacterium]